MARPKKFKTPEDLEDTFQKYIEDRIDPEKKTNFVSITDFCYFAGIGRSTFYDYEKKPRFRTIIKRIQLFIFSKWERQLFMPGQPDSGPIFWLKNFAGMADKQEISVNKQEQLPGETNLDQLPKEKLDKLSAAFEALEEKENAIDVTPEE